MSSQITSGDNQFINVYHVPVTQARINAPVPAMPTATPTAIAPVPAVMGPVQVMPTQFPQTFVCVQGPNGPMFMPMITQGQMIPSAPQPNQQIDTLMHELEKVKAELAAQKAQNEQQRKAVLSAVAPAGMAPLRVAPVHLPTVFKKVEVAPPPAFGSDECNNAPVIKQEEKVTVTEKDDVAVPVATESQWVEVTRRRSPATVENKLMQNDKHVTTPKPATIPTLEQQRAEKCRFCPGSPEHILSKCFNNNQCTKCNKFGHGTDFCKTPESQRWDPTRVPKVENRWWTEVAEEKITLRCNINDKESKIVIKPGYLLPNKHLCCAFRECNKPNCERRFHIEA